MTDVLKTVSRYTKLMLCLAAAVVAIWRGHVIGPNDPTTIIPEVMCALFAVSISITGFALATRSDDEYGAESAA